MTPIARITINGQAVDVFADNEDGDIEIGVEVLASVGHVMIRFAGDTIRAKSVSINSEKVTRDAKGNFAVVGPGTPGILAAVVTHPFK